MRSQSTVLFACVLVVGVVAGTGCSLSTSGSANNSTATTSTSGSGGATTGSGGTSHGGSGTGGAGGYGGVGGHGGVGGAPVCDPACAPPKVPDCEAVSCVGGACESTFAAAGKKLGTQTPGSCKASVCDGKGGVKEQVDDTNKDDGNDCTDDACAAGVATHSPAAAEQPCLQNGGKFCDGKGACVACVSTPDCGDPSKVCDANICVVLACKNAKQDGSETDIDCGGPDCAPCGDGKACLTGTDCTSQLCDAGLHCSTSGCGDGVKNGDETDVDCGGSCASKCGPNQGCAKAGDCAGGDCNGSTCVPNCLDSVKNGSETGVDCGGGTCGKCADGQGCAAAVDCVSGGCCNSPNGTCSACCDGAKDGDETDLDCGGSCAQKCADGLGCAGNVDCLSALCLGQICKPGTCSNGVKDGDETDIDCGGSCSPCMQGKQCGWAGDCTNNNSCVDGVCCDTACGQACKACNLQGAVGTCTNIPLNGFDNSPACSGQSACDGAGACKKLAGQVCAVPGDCLSGACADGVCCNTACGGTCNACTAALTGGVDGTCGNIAINTDPKNQCNLGGGAEMCGASGKCQCSDLAKNGGETDVDCGGSTCAKCAVGKLCGGAADCASGECSGSPLRCAPPSCLGGLDCGGTSCCDAQLVPGGAFMMGRSAGGVDACPGGLTCFSPEQPEHNVTVASYYLDTFEVTVGRFRKFVAAFDGTPPPADAGAHPLIANSGWQAAWNSSLANSQATLIGNVKCNKPTQTWTDAAGANENYAINCVSWFEAFAFCAWDGGRLPTEAEWEYAAAGGSENRLYPWGSTDPSATKTLANDVYSDKSALVAVGSHPSGNGKWNHRDLAGGLYEWDLDWYNSAWYSGGGQSCTNCANLKTGFYRVFRGGYWNTDATYLRAAYRGDTEPVNHYNSVGFRCARTP